MESQSRTRWRDTWLPGLLLALGAAELASLHTPGWVESIGLEAVAALLLVFRRRLTPLVVPLAALCLALIPLTGTRMDEASAPILFYILGVFSLGRWLRLRPGIVLLVVVLATVFLESLWLGPGSQDWTDVVFVLALGVPPFAFGRIVKRLDEQGRLLAAQQGLIKAQAVQEERDRIARELHDVLAHSISAMVIQSAAAREVVGTRPDRAADLLDQVAETGRSALAETARLLHLVRDDARELGLSPAPGLADVPALVESVRDERARSARGPAAARCAASGRHRRLGVPHCPGGADQRDEVRHRPGHPGRGCHPGPPADHAPATRWGRG